RCHVTSPFRNFRVSDVHQFGNYILAQPAHRSHVHVPSLGSFGPVVPGGTTGLSPRPPSECHHGRRPGTHPRTCPRRPSAAGLPAHTPHARVPRPPLPPPSPPPGTPQRLPTPRLDRLHPLAGRPSQVPRPGVGRRPPSRPRIPHRTPHSPRRVLR